MDSGQPRISLGAIVVRATSAPFITEIRNDDALSVVAMRLDVVLDRKTKGLNEVVFRLPLDTRRKPFAFAFAKVSSTADDNFAVNLVPGSERLLTITDCDSRRCRISLPKGLLAASKDHAAMDVGVAMRTNNQMLIHYPSGPDTYSTSVLLSGLQMRERELAPAAPAH